MPPGKPDSLLKSNENLAFLKQIVMGSEKSILYNNVEWTRLWGNWNEPPLTTPKTSLHPKKVISCVWWDWKGIPYYELLSENQTINSNKCFSQLDQLKAVLDQERLKFVSRKRKSSTGTAWDCMFLWWPGRSCYSSAGEFWFISCIHQTLYLWVSIYFCPQKILFMVVLSLSHVWLLGPRGLWPTRPLCPWHFPGKQTGVDCHFLLQGIPIWGSSGLAFLHCRQPPALQVNSLLLSTPWKTVNALETVLCWKKDEVLGRWNYEIAWQWQKVVEQNNMLFNKSFGECGRCVFYFY